MDMDVDVDTDRQASGDRYHGSHDIVHYHEFAYGRESDFDHFDNHGKYIGHQDTRLYSLSILVKLMATLDCYT
jgi:hypothetical protein